MEKTLTDETNLNDEEGTAPAGVRSAALDHLAANIRTLKAHYGWSFAALAERSGVSAATLKNLVKQSANPGVATLLRLADAVGLSLAELVEKPITMPGLLSTAAPIRRYRDPEAMAAAIGPRLRAYRMRRNWSRRKFIKHAGISAGTLQSIETSKVEVSLTMVERLAKAFDLSLSEFVEATESPVLSIARGLSFDAVDEMKVQVLLRDASGGVSVDLAECRVERRQKVVGPPAHPESIVILYAIEGRITVSFETEHHVLGPGDAILLSGDRPHSIASTTDAVARFLRFRRAPIRRTKSEPAAADSSLRL